MTQLPARQGAMMQRIQAVFFLLCFGAISQIGRAEDRSHQESTMYKVGGEYVVKKITRNSDETFYIEFHAKAANGRADIITLLSDHIHMGIEEGQTLRISAEVTSDHGATVEANQVLVFLPRIEGAVPVWILSKKGRSSDLKGADYLKMHAPQSDYIIL